MLWKGTPKVLESMQGVVEVAEDIRHVLEKSACAGGGGGLVTCTPGGAGGRTPYARKLEVVLHMLEALGGTQHVVEVVKAMRRVLERGESLEKGGSAGGGGGLATCMPGGAGGRTPYARNAGGRAPYAGSAGGHATCGGSGEGYAACAGKGWKC